jgi:hypothetical protein
MRLGDPSWFFNRLMLWGAGLGFLTATFLAEMRALGVFEGKAPDGSIGWEGYAFLFGMILFAWFHVAKYSGLDTAKAKAKEKHLEAEIRREAAYQHAFAAAIDGDMRARAREEALLSDEFREASEDASLAYRIYAAACKAAEGEEN